MDKKTAPRSTVEASHFLRPDSESVMPSPGPSGTVKYLSLSSIGFSIEYTGEHREPKVDLIENPIELKHRKLARSVRRTSGAKTLKPNADEKKQLQVGGFATNYLLLAGSEVIPFDFGKPNDLHGFLSSGFKECSTRLPGAPSIL